MIRFGLWKNLKRFKRSNLDFIADGSVQSMKKVRIF